MTDLKQAAQAVVDRWDTPAWEWSEKGPTADLIAVLRKALAMHQVSEFAQAQEHAEPVAWELRKGKTDRVLFEITNNPNRARDWESSLEEVVPLYTKQPRRKPLTREQRKALIESAINACDEEGLLPDMERFAWMIDAVERAHRIGENK
jgi:endonuclease I